MLHSWVCEYIASYTYEGPCLKTRYPSNFIYCEDKKLFLFHFKWELEIKRKLCPNMLLMVSVSDT